MTDAAAPAPPPRRSRAPLALGAAACVCALGAALAWSLWYAPASGRSIPVDVRIPPGSDVRRIARILADAGAVSSPTAFLVAARLAGFDRRLRPGDYRLEPGQTLPALLRTLLEGRSRTAAVTIPEGWRLDQIADRLAAAEVCGREPFLAAARDPGLLVRLGIPGPSAEGFLFPETYAFGLPTPAPEVVRTMHRQFAKVWAELTAAGPAPELEPLAAVTLASIVERETGAAIERPLVAAVFLNRLRIGMPLQADPTVIYGIAGFDGNLHRRDLATPGPYNTYVNRGLPPGPIASPGRESLEAVLHPAPVDYLYFVARADGTHQFSRTLAEHNRAVQRFQAPGGRSRG
jgi:UPF0755 protein